MRENRGRENQGNRERWVGGFVKEDGGQVVVQVVRVVVRDGGQHG